MPNIKNNIVLIGGKGYVGSSIVDYFNSKAIKITVIDCNIYNKDIEESNENQYINIDIRNVEELLNIDFSESHVIVLSGLVGDPITAKYPVISEDINKNSLIEFIKKLENYKSLIFISTCSNYGLNDSKDGLNEDSELNPISLYSQAKVAVENFLRDSEKDYTILRFATAFGHSRNMRFDLTLNEFTAMMFYNKYLEVYDFDTSRPYCHVKDFAKTIESVINAPKELTNREVFNVGSNNNNISKKNLVGIISKKTGNSNFKFVDESKDKRNYIVDFSKIKKKLNFVPEFNIDEGIDEIINMLSENYYSLDNNFDLMSTYYGNYSINESELS